MSAVGSGAARIGVYAPLELVSRGRRRMLVRCRDGRDGSTVVLKVIRKAWRADAKTQRRLAREFRIAQAAVHPSLIEIHEYGRHRGAGFIVMRDHPLGSLSGPRSVELRKNPRQVLAFVCALAEALHALHASGHVHLDVKPSNILLAADLRPVLTDYGLSRSLRALRRPRYLGGTPAYMSPEQAFLLERRVDGRSDVFSLGTLLFALLVGDLPFRARLRTEYFAALQAPPSWPAALFAAGWPEPFENLFRRALAFDPDARFASARDMAVSIDALLLADLGHTVVG